MDTTKRPRPSGTVPLKINGAVESLILRSPDGNPILVNVGGDIGTGAVTLWQALARPAPRWDPYATPLKGVYLCSAATPPGPGVHGLGGLHAARRVLRRRFGIRYDPLTLLDSHDPH